MKKFLILLFSVFLFASCKTINDVKEQAVNCKYTLLGAETTDFSLSSVTMDVAIGITNLSKTTTAKINSFEGRLYVNNNEISDISFDSVEVPPQDNTVTKVTLGIAFNKIGKNIAGLVTTNSISLKYKIVGKIYFDTPMGRLPFPIVVEPPLSK
jgi:hypothetical protein